MTLCRSITIAVAILAFEILAFAHSQTPGQSSPAPMRTMIQPLDTIAPPYDANEPVAGSVQQVQTAEERAAALDLLTKARQLSNVRQFPYLLKTTFTSYGSQTDGNWILEDTSPGRGIYRWTAQGPSFSGTFLYRDSLLSSDRPGGEIPLRLAQVRNAMWSEFFPGFGPHAALFLANGNLAGADLKCLLIMPGVIRSDRQMPASRSYNEREYCVYPQTGLLAVYSPVPGYFVRYDYSAPLHFHDKITVPNSFTIYEAGKATIEARTESIGDPATVNDAVFEGTGLQPVGTGQVTDPPETIMSYIFNRDLPEGAPAQVVVVAAMLSADGRVLQHEVLSTTDESKDQIALDHVAKSGIVQMKSKVQQQPGTTPRAQEVIYTMEIVPAPPRPCPQMGMQVPGAGAFCGQPSQ
ncbi:MAG TPA: hypothetical protein VHE81_16035 [Lacipirellulaceae bacterium]|nr:hypothetical protein [Lacipirellulaceae bacterium]